METATKKRSMGMGERALKLLYDLSAGLVTCAFGTVRLVIAGFREESWILGPILPYIIPITAIALMMPIGRLAFKKQTWTDRAIMIISAAVGAIIPYYDHTLYY